MNHASKTAPRKSSYVLSTILLVVGWSSMAGIAVAGDGQKVVETMCAACHKQGVLQAPRLGNSVDWRPRLAKGEKTLLDHALHGFNAMPPKGGNPALSDQQVVDAARYMIGLVTPGGAAPARPAVAKASAKPNKRVAEVVRKPARKAPARKTRKHRRSANRFNRLLRPASKRNPPPTRDGIHDPSNDGTHVLQHPKEAFGVLPRANSGNRVDWVKALEKGAIDPRYDRLDPDKKPVVMNLNIVREVKGSMPDVVYPHKQHTEWLDCSNCHPAIFIPKKGANSISMAAILLGEKCGVCHGKVAFPVAECRKCHSKRKPRKARK